MGYSQRADGFDQLRRDLAALPEQIAAEAQRIVGKGMLNIKKDAQKRVRGLAHLPHLPRSYSYDVTRTGTVIRGEGGADMEKLQGKLDIYIENGTPTSAPRRQWGNAMDTELPNFQRYADELLQKLIR